ncbi:MAG: hypothetical protein ILP19_06260, partial [Oscillospiraceae bacterium]|nr:hypothetical protein [Oscillospiraceae bacterium]
PQFGCNTDSDTVSEVYFSYTCPADEQAVMQMRLDSAVSEILDAAKGRSDRDTVRIIHDQIIRRCTYSTGSYENSAYGCLVEGQALCQGYTAAFEYLCSRAGIQTAPVETADGSHIWALVLLDGDYYHVDVTWDDPDDIDRPLYAKYDYFCTNDAGMADRDISPEAPAADGENDYFRANSLVAADIKEALRIIQTAVPDDGGAIQLRAADKESFDSITHELFDNRALAGIFPQKDIYYTYDRETLVIHIFP